MNVSSPPRWFRLGLLLVAVAGGVALPAAHAATPLVLLRDTFNGTSTPDTGNLNYNLQGRQSGALAPVTYTRSGNVQVGNSGEPHDAGHVLLCAFSGNGALDYNFNGARSAGGLKISFDLDPNSHTDHLDASDWGAITLGSSEADRNTFVVGGTPHFGILFRANGRIQAFDGSAVVSPAIEPNWLPDGNYSGQLHHFDIVCTDTDGNPFDGAGDTKIEVFVDGGASPVYSFTKVGGYAQNYINFQGAYIVDFENVVITALDTSTPDPWRVLAWAGDADSEISSSFTYTHAYDFGGTASPVINGVTFTGANGGNPAVSGRFAVTGIPNNFADDGGANVTGNSITLARSFIYGGNPGTLTLQGLTPGASYVLTLYSKAWDIAGNRLIKFSTPTSQRVIDQDTYGRNDASRNGIRIIYAYTADASGTLTVTATPIVAANTFHFYGFSNRQGTPSTSSWNHAEWTSDGTSGVSPGTYFYTHAFNFGSSSTVNINGLPFVGNAAQNPTTPGSYSTANFFATYGGGYVPEISGTGQALANQFIYDGRPGTLTVQGLVPGRQYVLSLYSAAFGPPGRIINFLANGQLQTIDQDSFTGAKGIVINFPYTAPAGGSQTVQMYTVNPGWAFHFCGFANREATAAPAPAISAQPQDLVAALTSNATFNVTATGNPPLGYQWYFGSNPIGGANAATLSFTVDSGARAGFYHVVVTNNFGSVTSRLAELVVRQPIPGLFNTGVDSAGVALADNAVDPHYALIVNADSASTSAIVENSAAFPIVAGPWFPNNTAGKWIGPRFDTTGAAGLAQGGGVYVYRTTVDLTGLDFATAVITGSWAVDNDGQEIRVNGVSSGIVNANGFATLTPFTLNNLNAPFVAGVNTIDFVTRNVDATAGYTGLRVANLTGTTTLPNTPPRIAVQPVGFTAGTGESYTFTVAATGSSPLSYQWRHAGTNLPGATSPILTLNNLTHEQAGAYLVVVTNPTGSTNSTTATLVVRDSIPGMYNTGVDASGVALPDNATDDHYRLVVNADSPSATALVEDSTLFPIVAGPWVPNTAASKWIGPRLDTTSAAPGLYTYRFTFELAGFELATAELLGSWASDNAGLDILINGQSTGHSNTVQTFERYLPFRITNGFLAGENTVDFVVTNEGPAIGWTGLRVQGLRCLGTLLPPNTPPVILQQPQSALANYNDTITFRVRANGSLPLTYQWYFENVLIPDATNSHYSVFVDFPDLAGRYSVKVTSGATIVTSSDAVLTINNPPVIPSKGGATSQNTPFSFAGSKLTQGVTDPDGDTFVVQSVGTTSLQGGTVATNVAQGGYTYTPANNYTGNDSFEFVIRDSRGGIAIGTMEMIVLSGAVPSQNMVLMIPAPGGGFLLRFAGIPGHAYNIQRSTDLVAWPTIATRTAPAHGIIEYMNPTPPPGQAFYRTQAAP